MYIKYLIIINLNYKLFKYLFNVFNNIKYYYTLYSNKMLTRRITSRNNIIYTNAI